MLSSFVSEMGHWFHMGRTGVRSCFRLERQLFLMKYLKLEAMPENRVIWRSYFLLVPKRILFPSTSSTNRVKSSSVQDDSDSDSELDESNEDVIDLYNEPEVINVDSMRNLLYPSSEDPIILQLNSSASVQEVFDTVREHEESMKACHISQAVLVLWDLQKIFYKVHALDDNHNPLDDVNPNAILKKYISEISRHEDFERVIKRVDACCASMSPDALTSTLLYLSKMGVSLLNPVMQKLVIRCEELLQEYGRGFPLTALSRFMVAVYSRKGLWSFFVSQNALPIIIDNIETCNSSEDFRLLTICLNHMRQMVSQSTLDLYKSKAETLVRSGVISEGDTKTIIKVANFLNYPHWSYRNTATIRTIFLALRGHVSKMDSKDLITLHKVFQSQLEPAEVLEEIQEHATSLMARVDRDSSLLLPSSTHLLACVVCFSSPAQHRVYEDLTQHHLGRSASFPLTMAALFKMLRHLRTSNIQLCDTFWSSTLSFLTDSVSEREDYKLFRICHRYMHFNNNLGGTYRHYHLEEKLVSWLWKDLNEGTSGLIPSKFARCAAFLLAYDQTDDVSQGSVLRTVADKLVDMAPQFREIDCLSISRGLQIAMDLRKRRKNLSRPFLEQYVRVDGALNDTALRQLELGGTQLIEVNLIMRAYINRRGAKDTQLFQQLVSRYREFDGQLTSRLLRDASLNLMMTSCLVPELMDRMVSYVVENGRHLLGETVEKLLCFCYALGYTPALADKFLTVAGDSILGNKERMRGLAILQSSLALCYFQKLPQSLIQFIFTVDFLEGLDAEIQHCYSKTTYAERVRHQMMQLNRAVCLDYPEADVPWFHEKYCQEVEALEPNLKSPFRNDVFETLCTIVGGRHLVQSNVYSPYSYKIDFQVLLNANEKAVGIRHLTDTNITRLAILLHSEDSFCRNVTQLKGPQQLKRRHLEMLGYRVVEVSSSLWNSMYMTEPQAKAAYLKQKLWHTTTKS